MLRRFLQWFFRDRRTGAITVAQAPNLILWIVIVAAVVRSAWASPGTLSLVCKLLVTVGLLIWAADEIVRGVNPWRRCLGAAVAAYTLATIVV